MRVCERAFFDATGTPYVCAAIVHYLSPTYLDLYFLKVSGCSYDLNMIVPNISLMWPIVVKVCLTNSGGLLFLNGCLYHTKPVFHVIKVNGVWIINVPFHFNVASATLKFYNSINTPVPFDRITLRDGESLTLLAATPCFRTMESQTTSIITKLSFLFPGRSSPMSGYQSGSMAGEMWVQWFSCCVNQPAQQVKLEDSLFVANQFRNNSIKRIYWMKFAVNLKSFISNIFETFSRLLFVN